MQSFSIIAAVSESSNGIGLNNKLPWGRIMGDMVHFKKTTENGVIIMGRKTFESLPFRPLKDRVNIVLSKTMPQRKTPSDPYFVIPSFEEAMAFVSSTFGGEKQVFVIGGSDVYYKTIYLNACKKLFLTIIKEEGFDALFDAYFPEVPEEYEVVQESEIISENNYKYKFVNYHRIRDSGEESNFCFICGDEISMNSQMCSRCVRK